MVEKFEFDTKIGGELDPEGEQAQDLEEIAEMVEDYVGLGTEGLMKDQEESQEAAAPAPFFRAPPVLEKDDLIQKTRMLVWEQKIVLNLIIGYCNDLVMASITGKVVL